MSGDVPFRIALAVMLLAVMPIVVSTRWKAGRTGERISWNQEGMFVAVVLRLWGVAMWLTFLLYLGYPRAIQFAQVPLPPAVRWLGLVAAVAGIVLVAWTMAHLGKNLTDTVVTRSNATLVTSGPYRWVRHPFYVSAALLILAGTVLSANLLMAVAGGSVLAMLALRTPREEEKLIETFGDDYRVYMRATPRYWPRWRNARVASN